jgi:hypothetical protein
MRHNLRMPKQPSAQRWRCPAVLRVKALVVAAVCVPAALVFLPLWFAVPAAAAAALWGLGMAAQGASVTVDSDAGLVTLRMGLIVRRVQLTGVTAVLVESSKVSIGRAAGGEISVYTWRKGPLGALLRVPDEAGDIGHAISRAAAVAQAYAEGADRPVTGPSGPGRTPARTRSRLATALLAAAGVLAIAGSLLVRVRWDSPVLTTLGVVIALALGVSGLLYLLAAFWIALTGQAPRALLGR